jgi:drug/metabolite transporter (DMT)-like permease
VPATVSLSSGERLPWTALAGMVLAFVAVIIVSVFAEDEGHGDTRKALLFAVVSGLGFGTSILCWAQTPASTNFAPLAVARLTSVALFVAAALIFRGGRVVVSPGVRGLAIMTGIVDVAANSAQVFSLRMGPVALAAVLGALYPVGTILLARFVLHEHLRGWQRAGIAMALAAVLLSAVP